MRCNWLHRAHDRGSGRAPSLGLGPTLLVATLTATPAVAVAVVRRNRKLTRQLEDLSDRLARLRDAEQERLHDARSAGAAIVGAVELICSGRAERDAPRLRDLVQVEAGRLHRTLAADADETPCTFDVRALVLRVVACAGVSGIRVEAGTPAGGPLLATGRPDATATALANLVTNAARHAPDARITLHARRSGDQVTITVDDDGPGLVAHDVDRIRRRGERGTDTAPGSGLGLYTADRIMAAQGGCLLIGPAPGGGTRAAVRLPAGADTEALTGLAGAPRSRAS